MGTAMNPPSMSEAKTPATRRRGRIQLLLIVLGVVGPMILATGMYKLQFWVPEGRSYHGELIGNGQSLADLGVQSDDQRWQLLVTTPKDCAVDCQQLVYLARQINIGLARDAGRAIHALASTEPLSGEYLARVEREYPQLQRYALDPARYGATLPNHDEAQLWIVDPHGNLVLRYDARAKGKDVLNDLRHLLKLSNIG